MEANWRPRRRTVIQRSTLCPHSTYKAPRRRRFINLIFKAIDAYFEIAPLSDIVLMSI